MDTLGSRSRVSRLLSHPVLPRRDSRRRLDSEVDRPSRRLSEFREAYSLNFCNAYSRQLGRVWSVVLIAVIGLIVVWTASAAGIVDIAGGSETVDPEDHQWEMFAPDPPNSYSWYVTVATYDDSTEHNLLGGPELTAGPPANAAEMYPNFRWRQYLAAARGDSARIEALADGLCASPASVAPSTSAETTDSSAIDTIRITQIQQRISPTEELPHDRTTLIRQSCA